MDIESKREEYEGFWGNGDNDDDDQGDGDRQKSLHKLAVFPIKKPMSLVMEVLPLQTNRGLEAGGSLQDVQPPLLPLEANSLQDVLVHNIIGAPVGQRKK